MSSDDEIENNYIWHTLNCLLAMLTENKKLNLQGIVYGKVSKGLAK